MKLMFDDKEIGKITDVSVDGLWRVGTIALTQEGASLSDFFEFLTDESDERGEPDFDSKLLDEANWWISDNGQKKPISLPGVHLDDMSVYWRWA